jgi:hypothetical protein
MIGKFIFLVPEPRSKTLRGVREGIVFFSRYETLVSFVHPDLSGLRNAIMLNSHEFCALCIRRGGSSGEF